MIDSSDSLPAAVEAIHLEWLLVHRDLALGPDHHARGSRLHDKSHSFGILGPHYPSFEVELASFGANQAPSFEVDLAPSWADQAPSWADQAPSWADLAPSWASLASSEAASPSSPSMVTAA